MTEARRIAPSNDDLAEIAAAIIADFPPAIRAIIAAVPIRLQDWPDEATLDEMGIDDPLDLTGLYRAVPLGQRETAGLPTAEPEMILLYRQPILYEWCQRGEPLEDVVFDVLTHEIGHHFGMDEAQVLRLEQR